MLCNMPFVTNRFVLKIGLLAWHDCYPVTELADVTL